MTEPYSTMEATYLLLKKNRFADHNGRYRLANILRSDNKRPLNVEPIETSAICEAVQLTCSVLNNGSAMNVRAWNEKKIPSYFPVLVFEKLEADRWTVGSGAGLSTRFQPPGFPETEIRSEWVEAGQTHWAGRVENTTRPTGVQSDQL